MSTTRRIFLMTLSTAAAGISLGALAQASVAPAAELTDSAH